MPTSALRLTVELVPSTCWGANLRDVLPRAAWDKLRGVVYETAGHRCSICGSAGRLHCHEVWHYDDASHTQTLEGFLALCEMCHHVKHIGHASVLAGQGKLDFERVVQHFLRVNGCDRTVYQRHHAAAMAQWCERSRYEWQTDMGAFTQLRAAPPGE